MSLQSLFRSRRSRNTKSGATARRLASSAARRGGLERLEDRRMLAFQYQGISITSGNGDQESYQLHFQVYNDNAADAATIYVRQNDVLGRLEFDYSPTFSALQSIPILTGTYPPEHLVSVGQRTRCCRPGLAALQRHLYRHGLERHRTRGLLPGEAAGHLCTRHRGPDVRDADGEYVPSVA